MPMEINGRNAQGGTLSKFDQSTCFDFHISPNSITKTGTTKGLEMNYSSTFVSDVIAVAGGHWPELLASLGIDIPNRGKHGPCPLCGGHDRFRLDDKEGRGTWICNQCGAGDGLDLVTKITGKKPKEAAMLIAPLVGMSAGGLSPIERSYIHQQQQETARAHDIKEKQNRLKAAQRATKIIQTSEQKVSPYLARKGLGEYQSIVTSTQIREGGQNFQKGSLIIPLINEMGDLVNIQLISHDGSKRYLAGGQKAGTFHKFNGGALVAITEGYATGLSVHLATQASVYCAMDCGNLQTVAEITRRYHPEAHILICGDNDEDQKNNPGKNKAEQAAIAVQGTVALPPTVGDWNDYHQAHGLTATQAAIMSTCKMSSCNSTQETNYKETIDPFTEEQHIDHVNDNEILYNLTLPDGYEIQGDRLYVLELVGRGENVRKEAVPISSPIHVLAETSDEHGKGYGRLLEWRDSAGRTRQWAMQIRTLVPRNGDEVFATLLDAGLPFIDLSYKRKLSAYLMGCQPEKQITCVERTGWYGHTYVLPNRSIGPNAEKVILQTVGYSSNDFTERGTLTDWQKDVSAYAIGNSRLCFGISLSFAPPLLYAVGMEGGGFHLKGESTDGKSTIMKVAASVYGNPDRYVQTWRATGNAIEGIANRRNDALLCLDELGELDGREAGQTAYMLANGQGKGRSKQDGELRERKTWRLLFLSTGELSLEDHVASAGLRTQAGMEVRTIQIPSNTGQHGAFESLHGMSCGRVFADMLKANAERQYGTSFRAFVEILTQNMKQHVELLQTEVKRLAEELTPKDAGNQVGRAINRFALVAAAGELATKWGITGWPKGEAIRASRACLKAWLSERGHLGNHEDAATLLQVRSFVVFHQFSRFVDWYDKSHRPTNMVGYRKMDSEGVKFYIPQSGWLEIVKGRDPKRVIALCIEAGYLMQNKDKRPKRKVRLPGMNNTTWVYVLTEQVLADKVDELEEL